MATYAKLEEFKSHIEEGPDGTELVVDAPWGYSAAHPLGYLFPACEKDLAVLELELVSVLIEIHLNE